MKEFNKMYIAKYEGFLTMRQLAEDLRTTQEDIYNIKRQMQRNGILEIYKNISDEEWEKLEKLKDWQIKFRYYKKSAIIQEKTKKEIYKEFEDYYEKTIKEELLKFEIFDEYKWIFKGLKDQIMEEQEEWKQIPNFEYSISNYGHVRNDKTGKIKNSRYHRWIWQVDIYKDGKRYTIDVTRMEAILFIRKLESTERVTFIDGDMRNKYYKNLKIVSM